MIDKKDFETMRKEIKDFDSQRDMLIKESRNVIRLSKEVIYSIHRNDMKQVPRLIAEMKKELDKITDMTKKHTELYYSPSYKITVQEYVEAMAYYYFVTKKRLPTHTELEVRSDEFLLGLCDLTGELVRKAINSAINKDYKTAVVIKDFVFDLYVELLKFDFRNGELRKKFDGIKYDLKKLEDLVLDLKLKGRK